MVKEYLKSHKIIRDTVRGRKKLKFMNKNGDAGNY